MYLRACQHTAVISCGALLCNASDVRILRGFLGGMLCSCSVPPVVPSAKNGGTFLYEHVRVRKSKAVRYAVIRIDSIPRFRPSNVRLCVKTPRTLEVLLIGSTLFFDPRVAPSSMPLAI